MGEILERSEQRTSYLPNLASLGILVVTSVIHYILAEIRSEEGQREL